MTVMRSNPDLDALVRRAQESGAKVLGVKLPDAGPEPTPPEDGRQEFTIAGFRPPSLNRLMRGKIKARIRLSREARERVASACREASIYHAYGVKRRVSVEITLAGRQRPFDVDAIWKALLDSLRHAGVIVDDSAEWCELGAVTFTRGETTSTRIVLEDL